MRGWCRDVQALKSFVWIEFVARTSLCCARLLCSLSERGPFAQFSSPRPGSLVTPSRNISSVAAMCGALLSLATSRATPRATTSPARPTPITSASVATLPSRSSKSPLPPLPPPLPARACLQRQMSIGARRTTLADEQKMYSTPDTSHFFLRAGRPSGKGAGVVVYSPQCFHPVWCIGTRNGSVYD